MNQWKKYSLQKESDTNIIFSKCNKIVRQCWLDACKEVQSNPCLIP